MYSPLWKIAHQSPSVLCTPPFEKSLVFVGAYFEWARISEWEFISAYTVLEHPFQSLSSFAWKMSYNLFEKNFDETKYITESLVTNIAELIVVVFVQVFVLSVLFSENAVSLGVKCGPQPLILSYGWHFVASFPGKTAFRHVFPRETIFTYGKNSKTLRGVQNLFALVFDQWEKKLQKRPS